MVVGPKALRQCVYACSAVFFIMQKCVFLDIYVYMGVPAKVRAVACALYELRDCVPWEVSCCADNAAGNNCYIREFAPRFMFSALFPVRTLSSNVQHIFQLDLSFSRLLPEENAKNWSAALMQFVLMRAFLCSAPRKKNNASTLNLLFIAGNATNRVVWNFTVAKVVPLSLVCCGCCKYAAKSRWRDYGKELFHWRCVNSLPQKQQTILKFPLQTFLV